MRTPRFAAVAAAITLTCGTAYAQAQEHVSFVACPVFRDTDRQCWTAEYQGKTYYIGNFMFGQPPQLLHRALVEGRVVPGASSCGAIVLEPVKISVLPEIDYACDTVLPDNGIGPSEPSTFDAPPEMLLAIGMPQPDPAPPFADRKAEVHFGFDSSFLTQGGQQAVEQAFRYAKAAKAARIRVTGYRSGARLSNGTVMTESPDIAGERARLVSEALIALGLDQRRITVATGKTGAPPDGVSDAMRRRVEISIDVK